jgi:hypothetical protein
VEGITEMFALRGSAQKKKVFLYEGEKEGKITTIKALPADTRWCHLKSLLIGPPAPSLSLTHSNPAQIVCCLFPSAPLGYTLSAFPEICAYVCLLVFKEAINKRL